MAPNVLTQSTIRRILGGRAPYSVRAQWAAVATWAARRVVSVWLVAMCVAPAVSMVLTSIRVCERGHQAERGWLLRGGDGRSRLRWTMRLSLWLINDTKNCTS